MMRSLRRWGAVTLVVLLWLCVSPPTRACPFCTMQGATLLGDANVASLILYGKFVKSNLKERTDFEIDTVIKDHATRGKAMRVTLKREVDLNILTDKDTFIVFCDVFKGEIDAYRGMNLKVGSKVPAYLVAALKVKDKAPADRLKFFFDYLDNPDTEISNDAYKEFANSDYKDFKLMAKDLPPEKIVSWLRNPDTPAFRYGLYASMLGHSGKAKDAAVFKELLSDPEKRAGNGVDGILAGYVMLDAKAGWDFLLTALKSTKEEFSYRYAALRAVRFFHDYQPDFLPKKQIVEAIRVLLDQQDIADLAIEDLRKMKSWESADKILALLKTDIGKVAIVQRAILRYSLQCKDNAAATEYVAARRKADPESVKDALELLELEESANKTSEPGK
jgi:hypothetical protein